MTTANVSAATLPATATATATGEDWAATIARIHEVANRAVGILAAGPAKVSSKDYANPAYLDVAKRTAALAYAESVASVASELTAVLPDASSPRFNDSRSARLKGTVPSGRSTISTLVLAIGAAKPMTRGAARKLILSEMVV